MRNIQVFYHQSEDHQPQGRVKELIKFLKWTGQKLRKCPQKHFLKLKIDFEMGEKLIKLSIQRGNMGFQLHIQIQIGVNLAKRRILGILLLDFINQCLKIINKINKNSNIKVAYLKSILEKVSRSQERKVLK